jgi:hypothetical protein
MTETRLSPILGGTPPKVIDALKRAIAKYPSFSEDTEYRVLYEGDTFYISLFPHESWETGARIATILATNKYPIAPSEDGQGCPSCCGWGCWDCNGSGGY